MKGFLESELKPLLETEDIDTEDIETEGTAAMSESER